MKKSILMDIVAFCICGMLLACQLPTSEDSESSTNPVSYSDAYTNTSSSSVLSNYAPSSIIGKSFKSGSTTYTDFSSRGTCSVDDGPEVTINPSSKWTMEGTPTCKYTRQSGTTATLIVSYSKKLTNGNSYAYETIKINYSLTFSSLTGGTYHDTMNLDSRTVLPSNPAYNTTRSHEYTGNGTFSLSN
jgi:hypothetical protein